MRLTALRLATAVLLLAACDKKKPTEPTYRTGVNSTPSTAVATPVITNG
jgi:hypothetical protein